MASLDPHSHSSLARLDHRPWPIPTGPWTWRQSWCDLLFAHWPVPAADLRDLVPPSLEIEEFDGTSWVGIVPFRMQGVMRRPLPDLPYVSAFPEINLRLYVRAEGKPGVWFLSLDAANLAAVVAARVAFHLPYFHARMSSEERSNEIHLWSSRRYSRRAINFRACYRPVGEPYESEPGTLENWLTERYCLYSEGPNGRIRRLDVHHVPWPLQGAEAEIEVNDLFRPHGLRVYGPPPLLHFSWRIDVAIWPGVVVEL